MALPQNLWVSALGKYGLPLLSNPCVQKSIAIDLELAQHYDQLITDLELYLVRQG